MSSRYTRRQAMAHGLTVTALAASPQVLTASRTSQEIIIGPAAHRFRVQHDWPQLPGEFRWQTTHGVSVDRDGNLYVIHMGDRTKKEHPTIFVFDNQGTFVRAFGEQYHGGGHGIEVRQEGSEQFLYVAAYQHIKTITKLTLTGEVVWERHAPMESGVYLPGEDKDRTRRRARDRFAPTNFAFADDGGFWLADGYGSYRIHRYNSDAEWVSCFGGPGEGPGTFSTAHGLWLDQRGPTPQLVVTDRARHSLQFFTPAGEHLQTVGGFELPANVDVQGSLMLVPELQGKVTLLNEHHQVVARLDAGRPVLDQHKNLRQNPAAWQTGQFIHPHDACFAANGDIFVAEWVSTGRVTRLCRVDNS